MNRARIPKKPEGTPRRNENGTEIRYPDPRTAHDGSRLPANTCPTCGESVDAASSLESPEIRPAPGDVALCTSCATVNEFQADYSLRALSLEEFNAMPLDVQNLMYEAILSVRRGSPNRP